MMQSLQHEVPYAGSEHYDARARVRMKAVADLHCQLCHPSDAVLGPALDSGCYSGCDLTSADLRAERETNGPCVACGEGKAKSPKELSSTKWHDARIGYAVFFDIYPLKHKTLGGNSCGLIGVDYTTGYIVLRLMKTKEPANVYKACKTY